MHDLAHLLVGAAGNSLACVSAALPCPSLPEERQVAEAQDHRTRHRDTSPSSDTSSKPILYPPPQLAIHKLSLIVGRCH